MTYNRAMSPRKIALPQYTLAQELWNSISHGLGTVLTLIFGPFLIVKAANTGDPWRIVSSCIFVFGLIVCFTVSCLYHSLGRNTGKKVFRVLDHDMIYLLIIGTYTPYCLVGLREANPIWAWCIYGSCVILGIVGATLNSVNLKKFEVFTTIDYIVMGWLIVIASPVLSQTVPFWPGLFLLLMGGVAYTVGAILYGLGKRYTQWFHVVFHMFVLLAAALMFCSIYFFVI